METKKSREEGDDAALRGCTDLNVLPVFLFFIVWVGVGWKVVIATSTSKGKDETTREKKESLNFDPLC